MSYLSELQEQDNITLAEALNAAQQLIEKYLPMLRRLVEIRASAPLAEDEQAFRAAKIGKSAVPELYEMLEKFGQAVSALQDVLVRAEQGEIDDPHALELQISQKLMKMLEAAVSHCRAIYSERSSAFAMILNDLVLLNDVVHSKLKIAETCLADLVIDDTVVMNTPHNAPELIVAEDEKLVFVRVFYRKMGTLASGKGYVQWLKPLLDSVKHAEKHGMAIYEHEADALRSLKGDAYGYVTLKIKKAQDISAQRPVKTDPALGCRLLTIVDVDRGNMVKLTHQSVTYRICDGVLHRT